MKAINQEYYGDDIRWFIATVIDNSHPYGQEGRIQIRIHGIHSGNVNDIPQKDLPWAQVLLPGNNFGVSGFGSGVHILPGALVFGMFLDGVGSPLPMVIGSLPRIEYPTSVQAANREDPAVNPYSYEYQQSNSSFNDPITGGNTGLSSAKDVAKFFIDNGLNAKQASSITGVLIAISELDPLHTSNGIGIAGWQPYGSRYKRFITYVSRLQPTRTFEDFDSQLSYVLYELKTGRSIAMSKLLRSTQIEGNLFGEKIDGVGIRGNGMVSILIKYYVEQNTIVDQEYAEEKAIEVYDSLGAV